MGSQLLLLDKAAHFEIEVDPSLSTEVSKPVYKAGATRYNAKVRCISRHHVLCPCGEVWPRLP